MNELRVLIDGTEAGTLSRGDGRRLRFEYDEAYAGSRSSTPLSLSMPLDVRTHTHAAIAPWLAGLLPDNPDVLRRFWTRSGVPAIEAGIQRLAEVVRAGGSLLWGDCASNESDGRCLEALPAEQSDCWVTVKIVAAAPCRASSSR